jgi:hypothetical protein
MLFCDVPKIGLTFKDEVFFRKKTQTNRKFIIHQKWMNRTTNGTIRKCCLKRFAANGQVSRFRQSLNVLGEILYAALGDRSHHQSLNRVTIR